jgi:hypothetical protein
MQRGATQRSATRRSAAQRDATRRSATRRDATQAGTQVRPCAWGQQRREKAKWEHVFLFLLLLKSKKYIKISHPLFDYCL